MIEEGLITKLATETDLSCSQAKDLIEGLKPYCSIDEMLYLYKSDGIKGLTLYKKVMDFGTFKGQSITTDDAERAEEYQSIMRQRRIEENRRDGKITEQELTTSDIGAIRTMFIKREAAENVLKSLQSKIDAYGFANLHLFKVLVGDLVTDLDLEYGWKSIDNSRIEDLSDGYLLSLPPASLLIFDALNEKRRNPEMRIHTTDGRDVPNIIMDTMANAEDLLIQLQRLMLIHGKITISDVYRLAGILQWHREGDDNSIYGWTSIKEAHVRQVKDGYTLWLPYPAIKLEHTAEQKYAKAGMYSMAQQLAKLKAEPTDEELNAMGVLTGEGVVSATPFSWKINPLSDGKQNSSMSALDKHEDLSKVAQEVNDKFGKYCVSNVISTEEQHKMYAKQQDARMARAYTDYIKHNSSDPYKLALGDSFVVLFETRGEANEILDNIEDLMQTYGEVTVAELYELIGKVPAWTDNKYCWTKLNTARVRRCPSGEYALKLPRPVLISDFEPEVTKPKWDYSHPWKINPLSHGKRITKHGELSKVEDLKNIVIHANDLIAQLEKDLEIIKYAKDLINELNGMDPLLAKKETEQKMGLSICDALLIGYDESSSDNAFLTVSRTTNDGLCILNNITGSDAKDLYNRLTNPEDKLKTKGKRAETGVPIDEAAFIIKGANNGIQS